MTAIPKHSALTAIDHLPTLRDRSLLVSLRFRLWNPNRVDRDMASVIAENTGASEHADIGQWRTHLVPKEHVKPILTAKNAAHHWNYEQTTAWDDGIRLLPNAHVEQWREGYLEHKAAFDAAVNHFLWVYENQLLPEAEQRLGSLYRPKDFPAPQVLRNRFEITYDVNMISDEPDPRLDLPSDILKELHNNMRSGIERRVVEGQADLLRRLHKIARHLAGLKDPDKRFHARSITLDLEKIDRIRSLNITGEDQIAQICQTIEDALTVTSDDGSRRTVHPERLRSDTELRRHVAATADAKLDELAQKLQEYGMPLGES